MDRQSHLLRALACAIAIAVPVIAIGSQSHGLLRGSTVYAGTMPPDQGTPTTSGGTSDNSPPTQAAATSAPTSAAATPAASGTLLAQDNFSSSTGGLFRNSSTVPDTWTVGYTNGEYQITSTKPVTSTSFTAFATGTYADVVVSAKAHLTSNGDGTDWYGVGCRFRNTPSGLSGYYLFFPPTGNTYHLYRSDPGSPAYDFSGPLQSVNGVADKGATHQLQISCSGSTISASIDGNQVASVQDSTYQTGQAVLKAGIATFSNALSGQTVGSFPGVVDARFSSFTPTQP
jgi:hypothetical protein